MIRHTLLFKFNESAGEETRVEAVRRLRQLGELCPTIDNWSIGINFADSPSAYDVVEIGDFASIEDLDAYKQHPAHREFSDYIRPLATWALADYEFDESTIAATTARDHALNACERLLEQRGDDPLLHANAGETKKWMLERGFPASDPEFITAALIGALSVYQKAEHLAFIEIDQGSGRMSESTKVSGQMATGAVLELGILLTELIEPPSHLRNY